MASDTQHSYINCVCLMKSLQNLSESLEMVNSGRFDNRSAIFLENNSSMRSQLSVNLGISVGLVRNSEEIFVYIFFFALFNQQLTTLRHLHVP